PQARGTLPAMATTDEPRADSTESKLDRLQQLRDEAEHAGTEQAIERQRQQGKLLARERLVELLDPGSFVELDRYARHREPNFGMLERRPYGDAVVTGYGTIFGRKVFVFSQDFTVFGGSLSEVFAEKICKVMDLALKFGCPVIGINDSGGARIQEGVVSPDERACLEDARYLLSFLPQNNLDPPPYAEPSDPRDREEVDLDTLIPDNPNKPYDMHDVLRRVVDDGDFLEVHERWAENIVCGLARLGGHSVGLVGNQPRSLAGVLDID